MIFKEILDDIAKQLDNAIAVSLMGFDGIPIATATKNKTDLDIQNLAIEAIKLLKDSQRFAKENFGNQEEPQELVLSFTHFKMIFYVVNDAYFLALLTRADTNVGKGRYLLKKYQPKILEQL